MAAATLAVGHALLTSMSSTDSSGFGQVDHHFRGALETVASSTHAIEEDVRRTPTSSSVRYLPRGQGTEVGLRPLVADMRPGLGAVDISVDQGGCFEATRFRPRTLDPTFEVNGSLFYCVANMPGAVPSHLDPRVANATLPYTSAIAGRGWRAGVCGRPRTWSGRQHR